MWRVFDPEESLLSGIVLVVCHEDVVNHYCPSFIP
jgi:hypothetical protein